MKVLVVGGGGREHALVWKLAQSSGLDKILCAPGNAGIAQSADCKEIPSDDISSLLQLAKEKQVDLTIVGPELPLALGITDLFRSSGLSVVGPSKEAALIESSKTFAKAFMLRHKVPTAFSQSFTDPNKAMAYIKKIGVPIVIKADGIAAGKGVVVAQEESMALDAVKSMMEDRLFGEAGTKILIEELLEGQEATLLVFTDGLSYIPMLPSQDHKRIYDDDRGPNTGGMGAYAPAPIITESLHLQIIKEIVEPTIIGFQKDRIPYEGILYVGLMITKSGPKVIEYNARFGDPETQVVLPLIQTDLLDIFQAIVNHRLDEVSVDWDSGVTVCVALATKGYPQKSSPSVPIIGIEKAESIPDVMIFHAATRKEKSRWMTAGGRVLGVTAWGKTVASAQEKAYESVAQIQFEGMQFRRDIALKALT